MAVIKSSAVGFARDLAAVFFLLCSAVQAGPVNITYELGALGGIRYEYRYTVTNESSVTPVAGFTIDFDTALYDETSLLITSATVPGWFDGLLGSAPGVPAQFDAYTSGAGLGVGDSVGVFSVAFDWLGTGTPGQQAFVTYDSPDTFGLIESGATALAAQPPTGVPEPTSLALALLALVGLAGAGGRRRSARCQTVQAG